MHEMAELKEARLPLTPHDFFGYLVPGATLAILIYQFEFWCATKFPAVPGTPIFHTPVRTAIMMTDAPKDWGFSFLYVLAILGISYVVGHIIASASVVFIDRMLVSKGHGYPYQNLLRVDQHQGLKKDVSAPFYRGMFFWINIYFVLRYLALFAQHDLCSRMSLVVGWLIIAAILAKIALSPLLYRRMPRAVRRFWFVFASPYDLLGHTLALYTRTRVPFDHAMVLSFERVFHEKFHLEARQAGANNYWMSKLYIQNTAPLLYQSIARWHYLYVFNRNLSTAFYTAFVYCFLLLALQRESVAALPFYENFVTLALPLGFLLCSVALLIRFYYLYVRKHTCLLFRTFVYLGCVSDRPAAASAT